MSAEPCTIAPPCTHWGWLHPLGVGWGGSAPTSHCRTCGSLAPWEPRPDLTTSAESWLLAGGPHHTVLSSAVGLEALQDFAELSETELLLIDESTDARRFGQEIRWNPAYHRFARGF